MAKKMAAKTYQLGEQSQSLQIFKNVALFVCYKKQIKSFYRLINITNILGLNIGVLFSSAHQLRKSCKITFNSDASHLHKLSGDEH